MSSGFSPHRFHILVALADRDLHGAGITRDVLERTDGELRLWPATLYGLLDELAEDGLIRELDDGERPEGVSERRRYYRITGDGRRTLDEEARSLSALAGTARERLGRV